MELTVAVGIACGVGFVLAGATIVSLAHRVSKLETHANELFKVVTLIVKDVTSLAKSVQTLTQAERK